MEAFHVFGTEKCEYRGHEETGPILRNVIHGRALRPTMDIFRPGNLPKAIYKFLSRKLSKLRVSNQTKV